MPRDAISRTANVERNGWQKWVKRVVLICHETAQEMHRRLTCSLYSNVQHAVYIYICVYIYALKIALLLTLLSLQRHLDISLAPILCSQFLFLIIPHYRLPHFYYRTT